MTKTMTLLDAAGIQDYIFSSNKLAHIVGGSFLVKQAIDIWPTQIAGDGAVVFAGGGNAMLLFDDRTRAIAFAKGYSRKLLAEAPGLRVAIAHANIDPAKPVADIYREAQASLADRKSRAAPAGVLSGLGVTAACVYTGAPAVTRDEDSRFVSAEIKAKEDASNIAHGTFQAAFKGAAGGHSFVRDFNQLGERGKAHLAIVHADGNGIGKWLQAGLDRLPANVRLDEFCRHLRDQSVMLHEWGMRAAGELVAFMTTWMQANDLPDDHERYKYREIDKTGRPTGLPFVPLVFGGDDMTFVCDGRLGLALADRYLELWKTASSLSACAGVAIVGNRFPIARAYRLAEELCQGAKTAARMKKQDLSAIDWHFGTHGALRSIAEIRRREYTCSQGTLTLRPMFADGPEDAQHFHTFAKAAWEFAQGKEWANRRNKAKELREVLRRGAHATQVWLGNLGDKAELPQISDKDGVERTTGWLGKYSPYFDAIEAMDLFVDMEKTPNA